MKLTPKYLSICSTMALLLTDAQAALITGTLDFNGTATFVGADPITATAFIDYPTFTVAAGTQTGDFTSVNDSAPVIAAEPFNFGSPGIVGANAIPAFLTIPISGGGNFVLDLTEILVNGSIIGSGQRLIEGSGILNGPGFDPTTVLFELSTSGANQPVSFSAALTAEPISQVPEPSTALLGGICLLGLLKRRR